jgi:PLD-like domain
MRDYKVRGSNAAAPFSLTIHRGEGMTLLAMNWRRHRPPRDFVGFGMQYTPPNRTTPIDIRNRLSFKGTPAFGKRQPSMVAPIQKFRWVHFPGDAEQAGLFRYVVTPVFMNADNSLRYGPAQEASLELARDTHPDKLNVSFTRGFVASQAFVERFAKHGAISTLLPPSADEGLTFTPTHPKTADALAWMGFEASRSVLGTLDAAIADPTASVRVVAYELNEPEILARLEQLGPRVRVIIDDSKDHKLATSAESQAAARLAVSAGPENVIRQHMTVLQHNKTIVVTGPSLNRVVCSSTNFSWRGLYVQNNNAVLLHGQKPAALFGAAFEQYWSGGVAAFKSSPSASWADLGLSGVKAKVTFSPHSNDNDVLDEVGADIGMATSSVLYSLAFLYQTEGAVRDAITAITGSPTVFVAGISDKKVGGLNVQTPGGNVEPVRPAALTNNVPFPFNAEPTGGSGIRLHHKFVVIDFDKPTARVYFGSYNVSGAADHDNGENLLLVTDRRVATSYAIEAVRLFDHYEFRVRQQNAATAQTELSLKRPPSTGGKAWFDEDWENPHKAKDRTLFA